MGAFLNAGAANGDFPPEIELFRFISDGKSSFNKAGAQKRPKFYASCLLLALVMVRPIPSKSSNTPKPYHMV